MSSSYYRNCKKCGRRIQLRQMPAGQWVAYEGYETIHDCRTRPTRHARTIRTTTSPVRPSDKSAYEFLDFADIQVPGSAPAASNDTAPNAVGVARVDIAQRIHEALSSHRVLRIVFVAKDGTTTTRDIEPIEQTATQCVAYCRLRRDFRTFRIAAIRSAEFTGDGFVPRSRPPFRFQRSSSDLQSSADIPNRRRVSGWVWIAAVIGAFILLRSCQ
jgi:predicted DNA-binding transcriptional regulator YafY